MKEKRRTQSFPRDCPVCTFQSKLYYKSVKFSPVPCSSLFRYFREEERP